MFFFFLMIRRPPRSTQGVSSAASDVYKRQVDYSSKEYFDKMTAYWRAANYVSVGQLYLKDNPLLERPLKSEDVKPHPIGHWGTIAGQNFIYTCLLYTSPSPRDRG
ncbi:putative phosphoketolase [Lactobacillus rhamnosus GG] [Lacticaseibacillus rhamnosus]|nr:putative phosphoketolase [Lactobacillus rhamnosus GG] [Lacticaseibacillus rhamnosus]